MRPPQDVRPRILTEYVLPIVGRVSDAVMVSSIVVAPLAALLAVRAFANESVLPGLLGVVVAGIATIGVYARFVVPFQLQVQHLSIPPTGPALADDPPMAAHQPFVMCFFSDLHVGRFRQAAWVRRIVELANAQKPDVIVIGGDFFGHLDHHDRAVLLDPLKDLHASEGVFAIFGNHDYGFPGSNIAPDLERLLSKLHVRVLHNECVSPNARVQIVCVDELWAGLDDIEHAFAGCEPRESTDPSQRTVIFVGHNPDLMLKMRRHAALFLFGHTHAGQIHIRLWPGMGVPILSKLYRGLHELPQGRVYVSSGCGETSTPTRLGTRPEIVVVTVA